MLVILVGKSGCGKSTAEKHFEKMISFTTRPKRANEVHGVDYYFYTKDAVEEAIECRSKGQTTFIKQLSSYLGNYYGTSEEEVERIKKVELVVAVMNIEGALDMKQIMHDNGVESTIVWVDIDESLRIERMQERANESGEHVANRWNEDYRELEKEMVDVCIVNNGSLESLVEKIRAIART